MELLEAEVKAVRDALEAEVKAVRDALTRPLVSQKQLWGALGTTATLIVAAAGWATNMSGAIESVKESQAEIRTDLLQTRDIGAMKVEIVNLKNELTILRSRLDRTQQ